MPRYILTVKESQGTLAHRLLEPLLEYGEEEYRVEGLRKHVTVETSHGRDERREYFTIAVPDEPVFANWVGIKSIRMVFHVHDNGEVRSSETTYFISSLPSKIKELSRRTRNHWKIENSEHYILDVTFAEDSSRIRAGSSQEISAEFRRMALNILQQDTTVKDSIRGKRLRAGWDETVLDAFRAGFNRV